MTSAFFLQFSDPPTPSSELICIFYNRNVRQNEPKTHPPPSILTSYVNIPQANSSLRSGIHPLS